jgi:hypothetical protein
MVASEWVSGVPGRRRDPGLLDLVADVEAFVFLAPNWDGEEAPRIDGSAIRRAVDFLGQLEVPWLPWVAPTSEGGVRVEWDARRAFLSIDFLPAGSAQVIFQGELDQTEVWVDDEIPGDLSTYFAEVLRLRTRVD